jgi:hypothetical protein
MKRTFTERVKDEVASNHSDSEDDFIHFSKEEVEKKGLKYVNMPKKSLHRMHAHINPFNPLSIPFPVNTDYVDWSLHYPSFYGQKENKIVVNTNKYQVAGAYKEKSSHQGPTP